MGNFVDQAKELVKSEDGVRGVVIGRRVYDPLLFSDKLPNFSAQHYVFLHAYRLGVPLDVAATKANLTSEQADRFLDRKDVVAWLEDRALKDHIKKEWEEPSKWFKEGDDVLSGKKQWSKAQLEVWKAFGERVAPAKRTSESANPSRIEINIDPTAVQEAFRRQHVIEAEIEKGAA